MTSQLTKQSLNSHSLDTQTDPDNQYIGQLFTTPGTGKPFIKSQFIAALVLLLILDLFVRFEFHPNPYNLPERSFVWWSVHDYRQLEKAPDIILFGSSLMLAVVNCGDATHYKKMIDTALHHKNDYLEELLTSKLKKPVSTFCFAIGGQMASDVYTMASNFITPNFKPRVIIWGIAPRDILDWAFPGAASTDTARYMNKIAGKQLVTDDRKSFNIYLDQFFCKLSSIYSQRQDFFSIIKQGLRKLQAEKTIPWLSYDNQGYSPAGRAKMVRELMNPRDGNMGDIEIGEWLINPTLQPSTELKDNIPEYKLRYRSFKPKTFFAQINYLDHFLQMQKKLGVKVFLINMPLTKQNMSILPPLMYNRYLGAVKSLATTYGASVLNFNHDQRFVSSDFYDTAHLNGIGCEKLIEFISSDKEIEDAVDGH